VLACRHARVNLSLYGDAPRARRKGITAIMTTSNLAARDPLPDHEQKQAALDFLQEAWTEARLNGVDDDCMAQICLFTAFSELVSTYGEEAAARYAEGLSRRISNGEFSIELARQ
jgi:hypothetical protein